MPLSKIPADGLSLPLTVGTAVASTSGTSIDFTSIPSGVKRITVMLSGVSLNVNSNILVQVGTSSGVTTTGYAGGMALAGNAVATQGVIFSTGVQLYGGAAANITSGVVQFVLVSGNTWVVTGSYGLNGQPYSSALGGNITLSGALDRVRITTVNGTDTFDAGTINIMWE